MKNDNTRQQLISKLREMFQMDQADLDFGVYRLIPKALEAAPAVRLDGLFLGD